MSSKSQTLRAVTNAVGAAFL